MTLRRFVRNARSFGAAVALYDRPLRTINRVLQVHILHAMVVVPDTVNTSLVESSRFRVGFASRDALLGDALAEYEMTPAFVEEALARGDECVTLRDGDRLAGFSWFSWQPMLIIDGLLVHLDPPWVCSYKGFTHPDYRGQRVFGIALSVALASYTQRGWRGVVGFVRSNNFSSRRSVGRAGWRPFGRLYLVRVFGRWLTWSTPGCKAYGVRLERVAATVSSGSRRGHR